MYVAHRHALEIVIPDSVILIVLAESSQTYRHSLIHRRNNSAKEITVYLMTVLFFRENCHSQGTGNHGVTVGFRSEWLSEEKRILGYKLEDVSWLRCVNGLSSQSSKINCFFYVFGLLFPKCHLLLHCWEGWFFFKMFGRILSNHLGLGLLFSVYLR